MDRRLSDLTPDEVRTWCRWRWHYLGGTDAEDGRLFPDDGPDYTSPGRGSAVCSGTALAACLSRVPSELCAQNILRTPRCEATVQDVSDCMATVSNRCVRIGHGCAALFAAPHCIGTVVVPGRGACVLALH